MTAILTAFATSPDRGQGLARDMRVRWALEELDVPYDVQLLSFAELKQPAHRHAIRSGRFPPGRRATRSCLNPARSSCTWPNNIPACSRLIRMPACARSCGCLPH